jgi:CheY-like chemotaxis protein
LASNGQEALKKTIEFSPDLVILDIMMPVMDGTEAAARIRSHPATKNVPIFFVTAAIAPEERQAIEDCVNPIFAKPVKFYELLDAIQKIEDKKNIK